MLPLTYETSLVDITGHRPPIKNGCDPPVPSTLFLFTILRRAGTCAAVDAPDEVPTAMDADLVEVSPPRTCSRSATEYAMQCSWPSSTSHHA